MNIEHFYSDMNGTKINEPFFDKPTKDKIQKAVKNGHRLLGDDYNIFVSLHGDIVEVKKLIQNGWSSNLYRDMYRIKS